MFSSHIFVRNGIYYYRARYTFRHTVTDTLKQVDVTKTVIAALIGHSTSGSMTMGRYGKRYQPKMLLEALMKLDYGVEVKLKCS